MSGLQRQKIVSSMSAVGSDFKFIEVKLLEREIQSEDFDL